MDITSLTFHSTLFLIGVDKLSGIFYSNILC